jgi:site-specific recombinase XerD
MLTLYRRHKPTCPRFSEGRKFHHCKCAIWADGILGGGEIRRSMRTRDWTKANREVQKWEAAERMSEQGAPVSLADAWESFLADLEARKLSYETIRKYKLLKSRITTFAADKGLSLLADFDVDALGRFRSTWKDGPRTSAKTLERLRAFFRFAHDRNWVERNPATRLKLPKVSIRPTMPFTQPDMLQLLTACEACLAEAETRTAKMNALRLQSLVLLMRYSGLRISDAVTITTDRLDGNKLFLYTQKTGVPVYTVLPDSVLRALESTPRVTTKNFFWSGESKRESAAGLWERLKELIAQAGISKSAGNAVSHRFRDTFAVELLLAGVPIERVSILLGHQSVRITEKHYNPWVRSRQEQLEADVARTWEHDPVLNPKTQLATVKKMPGTKQVQIN